MKPFSQKWLLISLFSMTQLNCLHAQPKIGPLYDFNIGLSSTDAVNAGFRSSFGQNSIGVNVGGGLPSHGFWQVICSASYYRHLWGHSKLTEVMPWYVKIAAHFNYSESQLTRGHFSDTRQAGVRLYIGRDFNITPRLGVSSAVGPIHVFFDEFYENQRIRPHTGVGLDFLLFYKLTR